MIELIKGTPIWVWLLLIFLLYIGTKSLSEQTLPVKKLIVMPIVFLIMTTSHMQEPFIFTAALAVGAVIGFLTCYKSKVRVDREHKLIRLQGSPVPLILIVLAFAKGYFYGYEHSVHPEYFINALFLAVSYIVTGTFSGIFIGRAGTNFYRYLKLPTEDLSSTIEIKHKKKSQ